MICRVIFNNVLKKILPIFLSDFNSRTSECRNNSLYDPGQPSMCKGALRKKITSELIKMTTTFPCQYIDLNNRFAKIDSFKYIFHNYKKGVDYNSPNLDIVKGSQL